MGHKFLLVIISIFTFGFLADAQPTVPSAPLAGNASNCTLVGTTGAQIDQCPVGSGVFQSDFQGGSYNRGNGANNLGIGAIWRFPSIATANISGTPTVINAEMEITALYQAEITQMDDNTATDQAGVSMADLFAPVIRPDVNLNGTDRRGYVEFKITFFQGAGNYSTTYAVNNLNFVSYDADGSYDTNGTLAQSWFRETRVAEVYGTYPNVYGTAATELSGYNYADPAVTNWKGFAGSVYERTGLSRCAEVASAFTYGNGANARSSVKFRFGYDFKSRSGFNIGRPARQYGGKFGCFNFTNTITLPLTLTSFTGVNNAGLVTLKWITENELNVNRFEIERSSNAFDFEKIATKTASNRNSTENYFQTDNISLNKDAILYYRLKMIDYDNKFKYSEIISIKRNGKVDQIQVSPNPLPQGGLLNIKVVSNESKSVQIRIIDVAGRQVRMQNAKLLVGSNTVQMSSANSLLAGYYTVQIINGTEVTSHKLIVVNQ